MAKYLKKFETETEYDSYIGNSPILPNVSLIGTTDVRYNPIPIIEAGNIVYYNGSKLKFCKPTDWSSGLGTAVAVVVVPNTHTPDGTVRCMAVTGVNPDGSHASEVGMEWGPMGTDTGLPNLNQVPNYNNTVGGTINAEDYSYLSSNNTESGEFTGSIDCLDSNLHYSLGADDERFYLPNPYLPDGSPNPDFRNTSIVTNNACADFDGANNTSVLVGLGSAYSAVNACHLYSAPGIVAGEWYLPAAGELGYVIPRFNQIHSSLSTVGGVQLSANSYYWSSSEYDLGFARYVGTENGIVDSDNKTITFFVRPFCSLPVSLGF